MPGERMTLLALRSIEGVGWRTRGERGLPRLRLGSEDPVTCVNGESFVLLSVRWLLANSVVLRRGCTRVARAHKQE